MTSVDKHGYEMVYVIRGGIDEAAVSAVDQRLVQTIETQGGEINETELWGLRTLAYPIKKHFEGHYILHRFSMPPRGTDEIDLFMRYSEDVLRYLVFRIDS